MRRSSLLWRLMQMEQRRRSSAAVSSPVAIVQTDHAVNATDLTTYTFSTKSIGTASAGRKIIVGICARPAPLVSSVTVAGVSAVEVVTDVSGGSADRAAIWIADVPNGTTGDIVVTFASGVLRCGIGVYAMTGAGSSTSSATGSSAVNPSTATLNVPVNGSAMAHALGNGGTSATWTNLTEAFDEAVEGGIIQSGAAADIPGGGNTALTCTWAAFVTGVGVFAAWGP